MMKTFEQLLLHHLRPQVHHAQDLLQFAYQAKVGVEDAILFLLHRAYSHLDKESLISQAPLIPSIPCY